MVVSLCLDSEYIAGPILAIAGVQMVPECDVFAPIPQCRSLAEETKAQPIKRTEAMDRGSEELRQLVN